jgi:hypothetical protein
MRATASQVCFAISPEAAVRFACKDFPLESNPRNQHQRASTIWKGAPKSIVRESVSRA